MKGRKFIGYVLMIVGLALVAQSCSTSKKGCGCGADINRAARKFH